MATRSQVIPARDRSPTVCGSTSIPSWGAKDLLNNRIAYVAGSRGAYDVQLFTDSREKLGSALGHDVSHQSAHKPDRKPPQREIAETPKQEKSQGMDIRLSL